MTLRTNILDRFLTGEYFYNLIIHVPPFQYVVLVTSESPNSRYFARITRFDMLAAIISRNARYGSEISTLLRLAELHHPIITMSSPPRGIIREILYSALGYITDEKVIR